tara:strand:- start:679 stop:864 length:186 start_codon:yes stop_codon:yes gene_type:complete
LLAVLAVLLVVVAQAAIEALLAKLSAQHLIQLLLAQAAMDTLILTQTQVKVVLVVIALLSA